MSIASGLLGSILLVLSLSSRLCAQERQPAPDFTLNDLQGQSYTLSELKGKVVLLDFWATWCKPCQVAIPELNKINSEFQGEDFQLLGINVDRFKSKRSLERFVSEHQMSYPVLVDEGGRVAGRYRAFVLPLSFLIDREGRIVRRIVGYNVQLAKELKREIGELLEEEGTEAEE